MFNSDIFAADLALKIESQFNIDMCLEDIFSDELNSYFNYAYNKPYDFFTFYFETESGSCNVNVYYPFTDNVYYTFSNDASVLRKTRTLVSTSLA